MHTFSAVAVSLLAILPVVCVCQSKLPVQQAIEAQYPLTKPTADHTDIVTAGAVIDLLKDNLEMNEVTAPSECKDTYKGGKFESSFTCKMGGKKMFGQSLTGGKAGNNRMFVAGEKFWLIKVDVQDKAAVLEFISDPISDVRYRTQVTYPFPPGAFPTPDVVLAAIKETVKAEPVEGKEAAPEAAAKAPAPVVPPTPPPAKMADIPPPPPPADTPPPAPKSISLGQTTDQVTATFGAPSKVLKPAGKEIWVYPDMKVTFVKGKVTDVQ